MFIKVVILGARHVPSPMRHNLPTPSAGTCPAPWHYDPNALVPDPSGHDINAIVPKGLVDTVVIIFRPLSSVFISLTYAHIHRSLQHISFISTILMTNMS